MTNPYEQARREAEDALVWKSGEPIGDSYVTTLTVGALRTLLASLPVRDWWREKAETAARALAEIPPPRVNDGAHVVWAVSDDVPESISVAQSWIAAMLSAAPPADQTKD